MQQHWCEIISHGSSNIANFRYNTLLPILKLFANFEHFKLVNYEQLYKSLNFLQKILLFSFSFALRWDYCPRCVEIQIDNHRHSNTCETYPLPSICCLSSPFEILSVGECSLSYCTDFAVPFINQIWLSLAEMARQSTIPATLVLRS